MTRPPTSARSAASCSAARVPEIVGPLRSVSRSTTAMFSDPTETGSEAVAEPASAAFLPHAAIRSAAVRIVVMGADRVRIGLLSVIVCAP